MKPTLQPTAAETAARTLVRPADASTGFVSTPICRLPRNATGLIDLDGLEAGDRRIATAIGLVSHAPARLARAGRNCIVEVHNTRIAVTRALAERLCLRLANAN